MKLTVKEFAIRQNIDYNMANQLTNFLVVKGLARHVSNVEKPKGTRGKPSKIYEYQEEIQLSFK